MHKMSGFRIHKMNSSSALPSNCSKLCNQFEDCHNNCIQSNDRLDHKGGSDELATDFKWKWNEKFDDMELKTILDDLMDLAVATGENTIQKKSTKTKLHKLSSPFMIKSSLNNSTISTSASDESNSWERLNYNSSWKDIKSDSFVYQKSIQKEDQDPNNKKLLRSIWNLDQVPININNCELMVYSNSENQISLSEDFNEDSNCLVNNLKKPVPIKYKTEICRNWENEGFCRFGTECIFAHGSQDLNRKLAVPSNYKTKICKQFTEYPFYCPYGEKCQFLHLPYNPSDQASVKKVKYSMILKETLKYVDSKLTNLSFLDDTENQGSLFKNSRLKVFQNITDSWKETSNDITDSDSPTKGALESSMKKTALSKNSREFYLPSSKTAGSQSNSASKSTYWTTQKWSIQEF